MASVRIQWSTYDFTFTDFTGGELPRTFVSTSALTRSATGAQVYGGAPYTAKYIWAISVVSDKEEARQIMDMFEAFDQERSTGNLPKITVTDTTFGPAVTGEAVFTTPPSVGRWGGAAALSYAVSFGITQV